MFFVWYKIIVVRFLYTFIIEIKKLKLFNGSGGSLKNYVFVLFIYLFFNNRSIGKETTTTIFYTRRTSREKAFNPVKKSTKL